VSFITLDDKEWCKGIYTNGKLYFNKFPRQLQKTWKYSPAFDDGEILFGHLWTEGKTIEQICPEQFKNELDFQNKKLDAFHRSFLEAKVDLNDNCFFDLVPQQFLLEYCELKSKIVDSVFVNYQKPQNYSFYLTLENLISRIRSRDLNLDLKTNTTNKILKTNQFIRSLKDHSRSVSYNQFGTKTGRLSTQPKSFPILTMNSEYRSIVKPTNSQFVELDYNAAEARTLLSLAGKEQPKEDLHEWNAQKLNISRDEAKKGLFAWLYGSRKAEYEKFSDLFDAKGVLEKYYDGKFVTNPFGRKIEADPFHALNYLVQSTTADLVLRQILKVDAYLKERSSFIAFIIHDAVFLDITDNEPEIVREASRIMANNDFGIFPVNVSIGKDFGNMVKIESKD
jgi:hypothetical protein